MAIMGGIERGLGVVTDTIGVGGSVRRALTIDLGQPVSAGLRPTHGDTGHIPTDVVFPPALRLFGRTGYRVQGAQ